MTEELNKRQIQLIIDSIIFNIQDYESTIARTEECYPSIVKYYVKCRGELIEIKEHFIKLLDEKNDKRRVSEEVS